MTPDPFVFLSSEKGNGISMLTEKITALGTRLIKIQQGERENPTTIAVVWLTGGSAFIHRLCLESFQFICHFLFAIRWFTFATPCCKFYSPYICIWLQSATIWALWLAAPLTSFIHSFRFPMMLFSSAMLKPVSFRSWSTYVVPGLPLFLVPCFGSQSSRSLITSSFFLQQSPINRSLLIISDSDYTITKHSMWNSLLRNGQSVIRQQQCVVTYTYYNIEYASKSNLKSLKN